MKQYLFLSIVVLSTVAAEAQSFYSVRRNRNLMISVGSGTANYKGDLVNPGSFGKINLNVALGAEYFVTNRISVRTGLTWFQLSGDDRLANDDRRERNLHFRSSNFELTALGVLNLSPMGGRYYQRSSINFHGFAGIGLLRFNPKAEFQGEWIPLAPLQTEGVSYSRTQPVFPLGVGGRLKVGPFFNFILEGGYRFTFTDYLDDVSSTRYPDPSTLSSDLSRALSDRRGEIGKSPANYLAGKRGNPSSDDGYFILHAAIQYYLPQEIFPSNGQRKLYRSKRKTFYRRR